MNRGMKEINDAEIKKKSGKSFAVWTSILDDFNVVEQGQATAERYLVSEHRLNPALAEAIVVKYEFEKGIRKK